MLLLFRNHDVVDIQDVAVFQDVVVQNVVVVQDVVVLQDVVGTLHLATLKSKHPHTTLPPSIYMLKICVLLVIKMFID